MIRERLSAGLQKLFGSFDGGIEKPKPVEAVDLHLNKEQMAAAIADMSGAVDGFDDVQEGDERNLSGPSPKMVKSLEGTGVTPVLDRRIFDARQVQDGISLALGRQFRTDDEPFLGAPVGNKMDRLTLILYKGDPQIGEGKDGQMAFGRKAMNPDAAIAMVTVAKLENNQWKLDHRDTFPQYRGQGVFPFLTKAGENFLRDYGAKHGADQTMAITAAQPELMQMLEDQGYMVQEQYRELYEKIKAGDESEYVIDYATRRGDAEQKPMTSVQPYIFKRSNSSRLPDDGVRIVFEKVIARKESVGDVENVVEEMNTAE